MADSTTPPTITSFTPTSGAPGTSVTITGANFTGASAVAFNGTSAAYTVNTDSQITATVPSAATSGPITVTTPSGQATSSTSASVSFVNEGISSVTSGTTSMPLALPTGYQAGDLLIAWLSFADNAQSITGMAGWTEFPWSPLDDGTSFHARCFYKVATGNETAPTVRWTNNTKAIFQTADWRGVDQTNPIAASGGALDSVSSNNVVGPTVMNQFAGAWAVAFFTYRTSYSADKNTSFSGLTPSGLTKRADSNLGAAAYASWENVATADSGGPGGLGANRFTATTTATQRSAHKAAALIYLAPATSGGGTFTVPPAPTISGFSPASGPVGTTVTISGSNFSGASAVAFNGTGASYSVGSSTQISATVPSGATSGPISVSTPAGQATSASNFSVSTGSSAAYAVYAGYYDTHHDNKPQPRPSPWQGSPNTVFVGKPDSSSGGWDTSTVRIDNLSGAPLTNVVVTVSIGSHTFALWGTNTIPAGQSLVLAQMGYGTFDGSDENSAGCYGCSPTLCTTTVSSTIPVVHVTVNGQTANFSDPRQILNTHGVDSAGCPPTGGTSIRNDESEAWQQLG